MQNQPWAWVFAELSCEALRPNLPSSGVGGGAGLTSPSWRQGRETHNPNSLPATLKPAVKLQHTLLPGIHLNVCRALSQRVLSTLATEVPFSPPSTNGARQLLFQGHPLADPARPASVCPHSQDLLYGSELIGLSVHSRSTLAP